MPSLIALTFALALVFPDRASAQGLTAGIKAGVNFANVDVTATGVTISPDQRVGAVGGAFVGLDINNKGGVIVEVLYSQRGARFDLTESGVTLRDTFDVDYIEIPVLGRATFKTSDAVMVHLYAGPSFAARVNQSEKIEIDGIDVTDMFEETKLKSYDIGLAFGGTLDVRRFLIDVRYTYGFTNLDDSDDFEEITVKNRTFSVMFGYRFK